MDDKKPMLWTRVDQQTADDAQQLADEHYDGNMSMLVRQAVKRFLPVLRTMPVEPAADESRELTAAAS